MIWNSETVGRFRVLARELRTSCDSPADLSGLTDDELDQMDEALTHMAAFNLSSDWLDEMEHRGRQ